MTCMIRESKTAPVLFKCTFGTRWRECSGSFKLACEEVTRTIERMKLPAAHCTKLDHDDDGAPARRDSVAPPPRGRSGAAAPPFVPTRGGRSPLRRGQVRSGQVRSGQVRSGQVCYSAKIRDHESHKAACQWATSEVSSGLNPATLE
jgi:hypothetical protein